MIRKIVLTSETPWKVRPLGSLDQTLKTPCVEQLLILESGRVCSVTIVSDSV